MTLPLIWITEDLTLKTLMIWLISVGSIMMLGLFSWFSYSFVVVSKLLSQPRSREERTMFHLLPSNSVLGGFFWNE